MLLDIMLDGVYKGQLKYDKRGFPQLINGKVTEVYDYEDLEKFVAEQRPSLKGKPFVVVPTKQRVMK